MNLLSDIITYVRRIIKSPSNAVVSDNLIIDYVNRFCLMDIDPAMQLFDFKTTYEFQTQPGINQYNLPVYGVNQYPLQVEPGNQTISYYPVYQGVQEPAYVNGIQATFYTQKTPFFNNFPQYLQTSIQAGTGDGGQSYTMTLPAAPALAGHLDITGIISNGSTTDPIYATSVASNIPVTSFYPMVYVTAANTSGKILVAKDSGIFLSTDVGLGLLTGNIDTSGWNSQLNVVDYATGNIYVKFSEPIPQGTPINVQCYYYSPGLPRAILFYNNVITILPPPNIPYLIKMTAYISPAAFLNTAQPVQFAYMSEYIARGAARKMLSDTGDQEQLMFYEPLFKEQEMFVWKRSQRTLTSTRTETIFSNSGGYIGGSYGQNFNY